MKRTAKHAIGISVPVDKKNPDAGATTRFVAPGTEMELTKEEAAFLDERGALEPLQKTAVKKAAEAHKKPRGKALTEAIVAQIGKFDPSSAEAFNRDGKPAVVQIERGLGYDINEAERDAGWEAFQAANPDLFGTSSAA